MKKKVIGISGVLIVIVALVILLTPKNKDEAGKVKTEVAPPITLEQRLESDGGLLNKFVETGEGERYPTYEAVLRLSRLRKPVAMKAAIKMATSEDKLWREAAAQALGSYKEKEALDMLMTLSKDPEASVRQNALQNIGKAKTPERVEHIRNMLKDKTLKADEKIQLYTSYFIATEKSDERTWAQNQLIKLAKSRDEDTASKATLKLVQIAGRDKTTLSLLKDKIKNSKNERIIAHSVRILSIKKDPWLIKNLNKMLVHESSLVRKATIQSIQRSCPAQHWDILEDVRLKEKDKSVLETLIREVVRLSGPAAINFLKKMKDMTLHDKAKKLVNEGLTKLGDKPAAGPCG